VERWRDKIEVRLDNRQVFFLFFGSALVACLLFVLGVIVGKRLESRGRATSPEIEDPLALLDKVASTPRSSQTGVTFPQALFGTGAKPAATDKAAKKAPAQDPLTSAAAPPSRKVDGAKSVALVEADPKPAPPTAKPVSAPARSSESKPAPAAPEAKLEAKVVEAAPAQKGGAVAAKVPESTPAQKGTDPGAKVGETKDAKPIAIPTVAAGDGKGKMRFALQLGSYQDKAEAEAFAHKFEGERPYMVVSEIPGKGTWYRVRVGDYGTSKDALAAKQMFEKKHNVIAYVAQK
jgi:cell division protein FtsN